MMVRDGARCLQCSISLKILLRSGTNDDGDKNGEMIKILA